MTTLKMLTERGADASLIRIINALCAPPALQLINQQFPAVQIYSGCIDEVVNEQGWIVPGLGDAGDRSFGTQQNTANTDQTCHKNGRRAKPRNGFYILVCGEFESNNE